MNTELQTYLLRYSPLPWRCDGRQIFDSFDRLVGTLRDGTLAKLFVQIANEQLTEEVKSCAPQSKDAHATQQEQQPKQLLVPSTGASNAGPRSNPSASGECETSLEYRVNWRDRGLGELYKRVEAIELASKTQPEQPKGGIMERAEELSAEVNALPKEEQRALSQHAKGIINSVQPEKEPQVSKQKVQETVDRCRQRMQNYTPEQRAELERKARSVISNEPSQVSDGANKLHSVEVGAFKLIGPRAKEWLDAQITSATASLLYDFDPSDGEGTSPNEVYELTKKTIDSIKRELEAKAEMARPYLRDITKERDLLKTELEEVKSDMPKRDGNWIDAYGACKLCGGELPHGHSKSCDLFKLEEEIAGVMRQSDTWERRYNEQTHSRSVGMNLSLVEIANLQEGLSGWFSQYDADAINKQLDDLRDKLAQSERQCAAMRDALMSCTYKRSESDIYGVQTFDLELVQSALQSGAGKDYIHKSEVDKVEASHRQDWIKASIIACSFGMNDPQPEDCIVLFVEFLANRAGNLAEEITEKQTQLTEALEAKAVIFRDNQELAMQCITFKSTIEKLQSFHESLAESAKLLAIRKAAE